MPKRIYSILIIKRNFIKKQTIGFMKKLIKNKNQIMDDLTLINYRHHFSQLENARNTKLDSARNVKLPNSRR